MNRFIEHQMLTTFKEFQADCHRHFKKYSDRRCRMTHIRTSSGKRYLRCKQCRCVFRRWERLSRCRTNTAL
uniref:CACTA en-spm transposon protein n=1 Tax=Cucumis melo TaxID=3656 RepID=A0A9I9EKS0_CUCME